jgi:putative glutathione S-transferase
MGDAITEVDWRAFTTLVRFDSVYFSHFKCIKAHYHGTHPSINPTGIVPIGPELDFSAPHARG